jgi:hypothetical protein
LSKRHRQSERPRRSAAVIDAARWYRPGTVVIMALTLRTDEALDAA